MKSLNGNTILITGGGSGIGLELAKEFRELGNEVLIAGRSKSKLEAAKNLGFKTYSVDMIKPESIRSLAKDVTTDFPQLNVVIQNAGIMKTEDLLKGNNFESQDEIISTNLLGPMRLTEVLLPHLLKQKSATLMTVSSGLAFLPLASTPTYNATKAAIHSYTQSLRYQLKGTRVDVIEIIPPYVQTHLSGEAQASDPHAMPLKDFISETIQKLKDRPGATELLVGRVHPLRFSAEGGQEKYEAFFSQFNDAMVAARGHV